MKVAAIYDGICNANRELDSLASHIESTPEHVIARKLRSAASLLLAMALTAKVRPRSSEEGDEARIMLGAYQYAEVAEVDLGEQFATPEQPRSAVVQLTTAMDEPFVNRTVTALLTEDARRAFAAALLDGLDPA